VDPVLAVDFVVEAAFELVELSLLLPQAEPPAVRPHVPHLLRCSGTA
jgi:hypothetical protein